MSLTYKSAYIGVRVAQSDGTILMDKVRNTVGSSHRLSEPEDLHLTMHFIGREVPRWLLMRTHEFFQERARMFEARIAHPLRVSTLHWWKTALVARTKTNLEEMDLTRFRAGLLDRMTSEFGDVRSSYSPHVTVARPSSGRFTRHGTELIQDTALRLVDFGVYVRSPINHPRFVLWSPDVEIEGEIF